jgi:SAM-dependent methyltransferase
MSQPPTPRAVYPGLLLLAAATLLLEVALARILSVALWYHFAFMVVSTALFGMGFAGVALALRREAQRVPDRLLAWAALATPVSFALGYALFNAVPFEPFSLGVEPIQWLYLPLGYLSISLPFFAAGLTIAALLTRHAAAIHRLYLADLCGAGLGALAVVALLPWLGGSGTVLAAAVLAAVAAALVAWSAARRLAWLALGLGLGLAAAVPWADAWLPLRISANKVTGDGRPVGELLRDPRVCLHTAWNTISRVDVIEHPGPRGVPQRTVLIDAGTAVTRLARPGGPIDELPPTQDEEAFFLQRPEAPRVLVVGSGGGREVLLALRNGAREVVGVEINPAINELVAERMADFTGGLYQHPRVRIHTDEARSFIRRDPGHYDVIHLPHTISNASLSSGSLSLAENHLMTLEAFEDYLARLSPDGVLLITRPEAHLPRLLTTLRAALEKREPARAGALEGSLALWRAPAAGPGRSFYGGLVYVRRPFDPDEVQAVRARLEARRLEPLYLPGWDPDDLYARLVQSARPTREPVPFAAILEPATDDRPFFNRRVPFSAITWDDLAGVFSRGRDGRMALEDRPVAESSLLVLLLEIGVIGLVLILGPLWVFRRRALSGRGRLRTLAAFMGLGLAYIVVEVGLLQRLNLYLGRPVVVFSTVLGSILVASGLGSAYARRFASSRAGRWAAWAAGLVAALAAALADPLLDLTLAWPLAGRVALAATLVFLPGFVMGMPFPLLVRQLERTYPERIPWAWGVNGFASVVGSVAAVLLGMTAGYAAVLWVGVGCYALTGLVARLPTR